MAYTVPYIQNSDDENSCEILGFFGILVQAVLAGMSIASLVGKYLDILHNDRIRIQRKSSFQMRHGPGKSSVWTYGSN